MWETLVEPNLLKIGPALSATPSNSCLRLPPAFSINESNTPLFCSRCLRP